MSETPIRGSDESVGRPLAEERFFLAAVDWELHRAERFWESFVIALIEADSSLNSPLARVLAGAVRRCDVSARLSEDRFAVLLVRADTEFLPEFRKRVRKALDAGPQVPGRFFIGAAGYPGDGASPDALLQTAAAALQKARSAGEEGISFNVHPKPASGTAKPRILVVDDDAQNRKLLRSFLLGQQYEVAEAENGERALALLREGEFDLVLLDVMMPGMNGFEVCRRLKSREPTRGLPVVMVTALDDTESKVEGIRSGADDFLTKPFHLEELSARTASLIRLKKANRDMTSVENVLLSLAAAVEAKDQYTQGHTDRAARLAMHLGQRLGLSEEEIKCLRIGGILHDVGKIGVPEGILNKAGPLSEEEWGIMKTHPEVGFRICESLSRTLGHALEVVLHHHEKLDGSSYPDGLKGEQISMVSRIMAVVDIYDALITDRPYRKAMPEARAFAILRQEAEEGKLDPRVVEALIHEVHKG